MIGTSLLLLGTATANYVGTFSLVPEDQCAGACICVGDQDVTDPNQEKNGKNHSYRVLTVQLIEMLILFSELNMEFFEHKLRAITALCVINLVIGVILIVLFGLAVKRISDFFDKMTQESFHATIRQEISVKSA